jgi:hypothetical protein
MLIPAGVGAGAGVGVAAAGPAAAIRQQRITACCNSEERSCEATRSGCGLICKAKSQFYRRQIFSWRLSKHKFSRTNSHAPAGQFNATERKNRARHSSHQKERAARA